MNRSEESTEAVQDVAPYSALASMYDMVMEYIDYESWVGYLRKLCDHSGIAPKDMLDISCGTGNTIPWMKSWTERLYCTDVSLPMVTELVRKMPAMRPFTWVSEMSALPVNRQFSLILNLQDSVNYYLDSSRILRHFLHVYEYLTPGGAYIFDFSTEDNIRRNFFDMHEVYEGDQFGYERVNRYNPRNRLNTTEFLIWKMQHGQKKYFREVHKQRMYSPSEFQQMLSESPFDEWHWYEDETLKQPGKDAERIHVVARKRV